MACIELSVEQQAEFMQLITESVIAAAGDKQRAAEIFVESVEFKQLSGRLVAILFNGIVKDIRPWHSGYNIEFTSTFTTKHFEPASPEPHRA
jgi:hypothetical protein